ncbi:DUF1572 domain-containing protein [Paenibacillus hemerocallicola]|uniref:DUF1572 domain-containing protein n=1 Tax=Paenibacillus hemerocallicola TaxID=1172614 RepID=A0A5C4TFT8_9BACL|nr:DUF1572 family protein [Paenibacillus hemerocallicola]TNJ67299.1 DUF1572 domain-containing protein [Paenibacillus hemerocallicola]
MDFYGLSKTYLRQKCAEIRKRMTKAVGQLSDRQLNWRPDEGDNSIANLIVHIEGNVRQRISAGIFGEPDIRDRESEFETSVYSDKARLLASIDYTFGLLDEALDKLTPEEWLRTMPVRDRETTVFEVLNQCANHFSEHLGQILYLAKHQLKENYVTTSIPRPKQADAE